MRKAGFVPAPVWAGALLWAVCAPTGAVWSAPERMALVPGASQTSSRVDWYRSLIQKGHASERLGQKPDALADYTLAIESSALAGEDQVQVLFDRGRLLESMGRPRDALADYNAALFLSPDFAAARNNRDGIYVQLGRIAEVQGDFAGAREFYNQARAASPHFGPATERPGALAVGRESIGSGRGAPAAGNIGGPSADGHRREAQLQLGAWRSEQKAMQGWDHARALARDVLEGAAPRIIAVDLPGTGRFYRLRVTLTQTGSSGLCRALAAKGLDCLLVHD